jgi:hypothetical protein
VDEVDTFLGLFRLGLTGELVVDAADELLEPIPPSPSAPLNVLKKLGAGAEEFAELFISISYS